MHKKKIILKKIINNNLNINNHKKNYIFSQNTNKNINIQYSNLWINFINNLQKKLYIYESISRNINNIIIDIINDEYVLSLSFKLKVWLININYFIKKLYEKIRNQYHDNKKLHKIISIILDVIISDLNIEKLDIKNVYLQFKKNIKNTLMWFIKINEIDVKCIKNKKKINQFFYIGIEPKNWLFISKKNVIMDIDIENNYYKNNLITYDNYIENIHIESAFTSNLIDYINIMQKITYKININLFCKLFSLKKISFFLKKKKENKHRVNKLINNNEIEVLKFIYNYNNEWLTNNYIMDYRGRLYISGRISYIESKLFRFLIKLDNINYINKNIYYKYYIACQIDNPINLKEGLQIYLKRKKYNIKNNFNYIKVEILQQGYISLDATSSMLQILGLLIKNKKILKYTNLIDSDCRYCIYEYIKDVILSKKEYKYYIKYLHLLQNKKIYKYSIMLYIYGSTPLFIAKELINSLNIKGILLKDLTNIINYIINIFKIEFKSINIIKNIVKYYTNIIKFEKFYKFKTLLKNLEYSCPDIERIQFKKKKLTINIHVETAKCSYEKKIKSSFVNIIHSLDSEIAILTRIKLLKEYNIKSLSIHDCFIVHINYYKECLNCYNYALQQILKLDIENILNFNELNINLIIKNVISLLFYDKYILFFFVKRLLKNKKIDINIKENLKKNILFLDNKNNINYIIEERRNGKFFKYKIDQFLIELLKIDINNYINKNINNYQKSLKSLKAYSDFNIKDFIPENLNYSLKPE